MKMIKMRARRRPGVAAVEMALSLPIVLTIMAGLWEVGRITEVQQILWNGTREAARDASLGEDNLQTIGSSLLTYLQNAERTTFGQGWDRSPKWSQFRSTGRQRAWWLDRA
jgi:Flp pilus assembly protein TadG